MYRWFIIIVSIFFFGLLSGFAENQYFAFDQIPDQLPEQAEMELSIEDCVLKALDANYDIAIKSWGVTGAVSHVFVRTRRIRTQFDWFCRTP